MLRIENFKITPVYLLMCKKFVFELLAVMLLIAPGMANAYTGITFVLSDSSQTNMDFVKKFKEELLASNNNALKVKVIDLSETEVLQVAENSELVIALGTKALTAASKLKYTTPILGVFTPLPTFNELLKSSGRSLGIFSAIVLDQPYRRQVDLVKIMLPAAKNLGALLGPTSQKYEDYLNEATEKAGLNFNPETINTDVDLTSKLKNILEHNDALIAIPDPLIYNRETAQAILLTSYRYQKPVFGYSKSYVKSGALASVFSSTEQLAKQAAEIAIQAQQPPGLLPPPRVPKYFSVQVNHQVARSLSINLEPEIEIYGKLRELEATQPLEVQD